MFVRLILKSYAMLTMFWAILLSTIIQKKLKTLRIARPKSYSDPDRPISVSATHS